ncbi:MAG: tetratricopeptide repeat protein [Polyangiaceae bacterium]|nr:tetratricopeptide repeat protein [Polyangiaceae bacterium]
MQRLLLLAWFALGSACAGTAPLPAKAIELNRLGVQALEAGDLETADARLELALEYNPKFVEALVNLGIVEAQRGNFARSRELLERARRLNPDVAQPHHGLGVLAERERKPEAAHDHYREALAVDPGFAPSRANLARLLFDGGWVEDALLEFRRLTEVAPDRPEGPIGLAECLVRLDRLTEADDLVDRARRRWPADPALLVLSARALLRRGASTEARALLRPLAQRRDAHGVSALGWLAAADLAEGDARGAAARAQRALRLAPGDPFATWVLARALERAGDPAAPAWAERAASLGAPAR